MLIGELGLESRKSIDLAFVTSTIVGIGTSGLYSFLWPNRFQPPGRLLTDLALCENLVVAKASFGVFLGVLGGVLLRDPMAGLTASLICGLHAVVVPHRSIRSLPRLAPEFRLRLSSPAHTVGINLWNAAVAAAQYGVIGGVSFGIGGMVWSGLNSSLHSGYALSAAATGAAISAAAAGYCAGLGVWTQFRVISSLLALFHRLPWRLLRFLNDAHERGTLRQAGDSWQFRHALLQEHLSEKLQVTNVWIRIGGGEEAAVNRLADLFAMKGRIGELRAMADLGNRYAFFKLISALEALGHLDEAVSMAQERADAGD